MARSDYSRLTLWGVTATGCPDHSAPGPRLRRRSGGLGDVDVRLVELLDVHVLEGQHLHALGEARGPVHVPDPGVGDRDLEEDLAGLAARLHVHLVAQVEA